MKMYKTLSEFIGWSKAEEYVSSIILKNNIKTVLEVGAGANPTINPNFINKNNLIYTISDIDEKELAKADKIYTKLVINLSSKNKLHLQNEFDLIFSRMTAEHITNAEVFHSNIYNMLNSGGYSFHCFSTLLSFPFLTNWILPDSLSDKILNIISPRDKHQHGKFIAKYEWCYGPTKKMIQRYEKIGFQIIEYVGYFGHNYYNKFPLLKKLERIKSNFLLQYPISYLTSYAHILLRKSL